MNSIKLNSLKAIPFICIIVSIAISKSQLGITENNKLLLYAGLSGISLLSVFFLFIKKKKLAMSNRGMVISVITGLVATLIVAYLFIKNK
ncbi:LPXTG cell wall anchor domain-containing protein [Ferruginibacter profundus]